MRRTALVVLSLLLLWPINHAWVQHRLPSSSPRVAVGGRWQLQQHPESSFIDAETISEPDIVAVGDAAAVTMLDDDDKSLLDLALESSKNDGEEERTRIPFLDYQHMSSSGAPAAIDTHLVFRVAIDDVVYGIGVPADAAAVVVVVVDDEASRTNANTTVTVVTPDGRSHPDTDELLELMAVRLQELVGQDLQLLRTPRYLTIAGPLDRYTENWQANVLKDNASLNATDLLQKLYAADEEAKEYINTSSDGEEEEDDDGGLAFFYDFMKKELGEDEFAKAMADESDLTDTDDLFTPEMLDLFDMPELTTESLTNPEEDWEFARENLGMDKNFGLQLVSFTLKDKTYSLAKLMQPVTLVAKLTEDDTFEMLRPEEEDLLFPQIEQKFRQELENAGLKLRP